ncbi:MAG: hypothetical protein K0U52_02835 [Gammaproteobacteria bacterium]|nr:hypothetical protein [Gammaproteobacteria bacterium]
MSDFFQCDCVRLWMDHTKWCNLTAHMMIMDDADHDGCDGHENGEPVHCTDYCVMHDDELKCTMCGHRWTVVE